MRVSAQVSEILSAQVRALPGRTHWWQEKEDEWSDGKTWEKEEEEAAAAKAREDQKQPAKTKKEEPEEERNVLRGPEARWKNRTRSPNSGGLRTRHWKKEKTQRW